MVATQSKGTRRDAQLRVAKGLKPRFRLEKTGVVIVTVFVSLVFPILEAMLLEQLPPPSWFYWLPFGAVVVLHLTFGILLIIRTAKSETFEGIDLLEVSFHCDILEEELTKKREACRLAREVFEMLNIRTCRLKSFSAETPASDDWWKEEGLQPGLDSLMSALVDNRSSLLGVVGTQWTIEIYLDAASIQDPTERVQIDFGAQYKRAWARCSEGLIARTKAPLSYHPEDYPVGIACKHNTGFVRTREEDHHLLPTTGDDKFDESRVYYTRYAVQPFFVACSRENVLGAILVTTEQAMAFNEDILNTLRFYGAVIANFVYAYGECMWTDYTCSYVSDDQPQVALSS